MDASKKQRYNELMEFEKTIYNILKAFEKQLDNEKFNLEVLDYELFHISKPRYIKYLQMLMDAGYIDGLSFVTVSDNQTEVKAHVPTITLKGLEYLAENSMMKKVAKVLKGGASVTISAASSVLP